MSNFIVPIRGMHCKSCEILIEKHLKKIPGVTSVKAHQRAGKAEVVAHRQIAPELIADAVKTAGYEVGEKEKLPWVSRDANDYLELGIIALILAVLFLSAKGYGLFSVSLIPSGSGLVIALLVGLVAGVSTCMALIGGLVLGVAARYAEMHPEATPAKKFRPHLVFNAGRIAGYALFGGMIGLIGKAFQPSPNLLGLLTIIVGAVMIFLGLKLIEIFPALRDKSLALPASIGKFLGVHNKDSAEYSHIRAGITGALTFFLPCGFTQAMQLYAVSTGSFASGAAIMGLFALGTAPGLLSVAGLASVLKGQAARRFFMAAGLLVILLGSYNLVNASRLISFGSVNQDAVVSNQEPQVVTMTQSDTGYSPNSFTVVKGRPVKWIITSTNPYTCASSIVMRKYGITQNLKKGQNVIEFTPTEVGTIPFSCSMGMYRGTFTVIDSADSGEEGVSQKTDTATVAAAGAGCSAGGGGGGGCGGGQKFVPQPGTVEESATSGTQVLKATYTVAKGMVPNTFTVKKGKPVELDLDAKEDGRGCMGSIMISGVTRPQPIRRGSMKLTFTPTETGTVSVTCAMGVPHGRIAVID
ncbi:MAG: hypothetical protein A3B31_03770 [Candidatus Komeilibacteria bacterium RIFCSPLOWO2_01_FULL_53_11]|uniref:HMA domain-containing protein n=1 Tax=Candidatus Komeilibacteria bacterium RIFCSPLOWO2_01_FULL_53_11 TaxID=1798552 RepID=A0A1G2BQX3_9BACT|nr:MAG: hypothetical protein A3B31_03770 [Candidatus Komeilibacteria bacterium RIFCSPLOWO2_01_FULL_53_11]